MINKNSIAIATGFIVMGLLIGYPGVIVQKASSAMSLNMMQKGTLLAVQFWGCAGGIFFGMLVSEIIGKKRFLYLGSLMIVAGFLIGIFANTYMLLLLSFLAAGVGLGFFESGYNAMCLDYVAVAFPTTKSQSTSLFHFFFGLGAIISPIIIEALTMVMSQYNSVFAVLVPVPLLCAFLLFKSDNFAPVVEKGSLNRMSFKTILVICFFFLASALYVGAETTVYGWLPTYWASLESAHIKVLPGFAVSLFWITFSLGRLAGGPPVSKLGDSRYIITVTVLALLLAIAWSFPGQNSLAVLIYIALAGLLLSCIFPTLLVSFDRALPGQSGTVSGLFLFGGTLSAAIFPTISGYAFKKAGIAVLPFFWGAVLVVFLLISCAAFITARHNQKSLQ